MQKRKRLFSPASARRSEFRSQLQPDSVPICFHTAERWHDLLLYFVLLLLLLCEREVRVGNCSEFISSMHAFRYVWACLQVTNYNFHTTSSFFSEEFCVSLHMQLKLRSINVVQGDLWSAAGEWNTPLMHSAYILFGGMIYELCPRVAGFIFLLLTAPPWRLGPLWDEG